MSGQYPSRKSHTYYLSSSMIKARSDFIPTFIPYSHPTPIIKPGFLFFLDSSFLHLICFCSLSRDNHACFHFRASQFSFPSNLQRRSGNGASLCISICLFGGACGEPFFLSLALKLPASLTWPTHGLKLSFWVRKIGTGKINIKKQMP